MNCLSKMSFLLSRSSVCLLSCLVAFSAHSQPYPGYDGGPQFRFDNGAVGTAQKLDDQGNAVVEYHNGGSNVTGTFPIEVDPDIDPAEPGSSDYARAVEAAGRGNPVELTVSGPNECFKSTGLVADPSVARDRFLIVACRITGLDECRRVSSFPTDDNGEALSGKFSAPCIGAVNEGEDQIRIDYLVSEAAAWCFYTGPCVKGLYGQRIFNINLDFRISDAFADPSIITDKFDECFDAHGYGQWPGACSAFDARLFGVGPLADQAASFDLPQNTAPINVPVPAPAGLSGETMNPGGFEAAGVGGTSSGGSLTPAPAGSGSGGGSGDGSGSGEGSGTGGDGSGTGGPLCEGDDCVIEAGPGTASDVPSDGIDLSSGIIDEGDGWLGSRSCPAPLQLDIIGSSITISFDLICQWAGIIRLIVIASATMAAAAIVMDGLRK